MRERKQFDPTGLIAGLVVSVTLAAVVYAGSIGLKHFDRSIIGYALGSGLAAFAIGYRLATWMKHPPARMYFQRALEILLRRTLWKNSVTISTRTGITNRMRVVPASKPVGSRSSPTSCLVLQKAAQTKGQTTFRSGILSMSLLSLTSCGLAACHLLEQTWLIAKATATKFIFQTSVRRRSYYRWIMHLCLSGGCTMAFAITFPLVFGWVHFESFAENAEMYRVKLFGFGIDSFEVHGVKAFVAFNLLNFASAAVLIGLIMAGVRRIRSAEERAIQKFSEDILPLALIGIVTLTGLTLTLSYKFLGGLGHSSVAVAHMISVVVLLIYIPFGKLFHMFQRVCSLAVALYKKAGAASPHAACYRCGEPFASQIHVADLKIVLDQLGFNYRFATPQGELHYQDICPACRRRLLALNQGRTLNR